MNKSFFIFLLLTLTAVPASFAQWVSGTPSGTIHYDGGRVAIGTDNPWAKFMVVGGDAAVIGTDLNGTAVVTSRGGNAFFGNNLYNNGLNIDPSGRIAVGTTAPAYLFEINSADNSNAPGQIPARLRIANTASSGTNAPGSFPAIEVLGARGDGNATFEGRLALGTRRTDGNTLTNQTLGVVLFGGQYGSDQTFQAAKILYPASIKGIAEGSFSAANTMPTAIVFSTGTTGDDVGTGNLPYGAERMRITSAGNVGIGTSNPGTAYKLAVEGTVGARRVVVTQASWADYVFDKKYKLPSLTEVEKYIRKNQHLPGIPSAAAIKEKGLDLADTQALLLQKIEELTLYSIDQNKKIETQQQEIDELKTLVKKLLNR